MMCSRTQVGGRPCCIYDHKEEISHTLFRKNAFAGCSKRLALFLTHSCTLSSPPPDRVDNFQDDISMYISDHKVVVFDKVHYMLVGLVHI